MMAKPNDTGFTFRGKPICLTKTFGRPVGGLVAMGMKRGIYPESKRIEVVTLYTVTGNLKRVSELSKVPEDTIRQWRKQEWFQSLMTEIREENNEKIDAKFTEIVEKTQELVLDRLVNGDFAIHPKTGEMIRKPVNIRDLSIVSAITVDKRQLLRGLPTSRTEQVGTQADKLTKLAESFMQLANKAKQPRVIEAEVIEINDNQENQGRLQGSVGEIGQESGSVQDAGGSQEPAPTSGIFQTKR